MVKLRFRHKLFSYLSLLFLLNFGCFLFVSAAADNSQAQEKTAAKERELKSDPATLFGLDKIITVEITMTAEAWDKATPPQRMGGPGGFGRPFGPPPNTGQSNVQGMNPRPDNARGGFGFQFEYVHGDVVVDGDTFKDAGVRFKGNSSYGASQRSLKHPLKFDFDQYVKNGKLRGMTTLNFSNNAMDPPQMREALAYEIFRQAGIPCSRTAFVKMYLTIPGKYDKQYLGLYTMVEQVDEIFLQTHFGNHSGLLVKPERVGALQYLGENWDAYKERYEPKSGHKGKDAEAARQRLIEFTKLVNQADEKEFRSKIDAYLDVDSFLNFLAVNAVLANLDSFLSMGHNFYLYLNPSTNKFIFLPWDLNMAFGGFGMAGGGEAQTDLSLMHPHSGQNKLIERLLEMEKPRETYRTYVRKLMDSSFKLDKLEKQISTIEKLTAEAISAEPEEAKLTGPGGGMRFGNGGAPPQGVMMGRGMFGAPALRDFVAKRIESVNLQLAGKRTGFVPQNRMGMGGGPMIINMGGSFAPQFMEAADTNKNNDISEAEFSAATKRFFDLADVNKDKQLSNEEIIKALDSILPLPPPPPGFDPNGGGPGGGFRIRGPGGMFANQLLRLADLDANNSVSLSEWTTSSAKTFADWDADKNKSLSEKEVADGFGKLMPRPMGMPGGFDNPPVPPAPKQN